MSTRKLNALLLLLGLSLPAMAQSVDYSVVAVGEESGLDFKKITSDNDCLCMPEVKRRGKKITWWSGRVIAMSPTEEKLAFLSYKTNNSNIYLKNLTGAGTTQQRTNRQQVIDFSYSPDGKWILMVGNSMKVVDVAGQNSQNKVYPNTDIFACHIDGSNLTQNSPLKRG